MITEQHAQTSPWWQEHRLEIEETCRLQLGSIDLYLSRSVGEWRLSYDYTGIENIGHFSIGTKNEQELEPNLQRLASKDDTGKFSIKPWVADKTYVIKPTSPIHLPKDESAIIYMSSIIWLKICIGNVQSEWLSIPVQIPTETWMGENTMVGELCYTSKTAGRLRLSLLPQRPFRAITPVTIINNGSDTLLIDNISLPLPYLSIYGNQQGEFWTEAVTITRNVNLQAAKLEVGEATPTEAVDAFIISEPRKIQQDNQFIKTVHQLFG